MSDYFDVVVLGAGPTAMGALHRFRQLQQRGHVRASARILLVEKEAEPGGLARTVTDAHGFSWDLGVHVTGASKFPAFLRMLDDVIPRWNVVPRCVLADISHVAQAPSGSTDNYCPYPVQSSIHHFPRAFREKCLAELEAIYAADGPQTGSENFAEFSRNHFGQTLQDIFIRPYNEKAMSSDWVEGRVPPIDLPRLRRLCADAGPAGGAPTAADGRARCSAGGSQSAGCFRYPADCRGMGEVWTRLAGQFPAACFRFNSTVTGVDVKAKRLSVTRADNSTTHIRYEMLVSTIPLTQLNRLTRLLPALPLRHSKVALVGVGLHGPANQLAQRLCWAYYPTKEVVFYRCTVISNFSERMTPDPHRFWSVLCEVGRRPDEPLDGDNLVQRTIADLVKVGVVDEAGQVCSTWFHVIPYGYPIPTTDRQALLDECHERLEANSIYSRGRFGAWRYETSNQDNCFESGRRLMDRLFLDEDELPY